jgi:hypothetical protein
MASSINDWYDNAASRRDGGFSYDPENDDPIDHTPDAWLDRLPQRSTPALRRPVPSRRKESPPTSGRPSARRSTDAATPGELARVARAVHARRPDIKIDRLTEELRERFGWPTLNVARVAEALGRKRGTSLVDDARKIMTSIPGIGPKKLAARLRELGWSGATASSIQAMLQKTPRTSPTSKPSPTARRKPAPKRDEGWIREVHRGVLRGSAPASVATTPQTHKTGPLPKKARVEPPRKSTGRAQQQPKTPRKVQQQPKRAQRSQPNPPMNRSGPQRSLDIRERPDVPTCHGCGRMISSLGYCGCS